MTGYLLPPNPKEILLYYLTRMVAEPDWDMCFGLIDKFCIAAEQERSNSLSVEDWHQTVWKAVLMIKLSYDVRIKGYK